MTRTTPRRRRLARIRCAVRGCDWRHLHLATREFSRCARCGEYHERIAPRGSVRLGEESFR